MSDKYAFFGRCRPQRVLTGLDDHESVRCLSAGPDRGEGESAWHYHAEFELQLIEADAGTLYVGDYVGQTEGPLLLLLGPELPHRYLATDPAGHSPAAEPLSLYFPAELLCTSSAAIPELEMLQPLIHRAARGVAFDPATVEAVRPMFHRVRAASGLSRLALFLLLMTHLSASEAYRLLCSRGFSPLEEAKARQFREAVRYIERHYDRGLSLKCVAAAVNMTPKALSRLFKQECGHGVMEYLNRVRISEACRRLVASCTPITEICHDVGFNNISNFNRRFLAVKGVTPSCYRKAFSQL